MIQSKVNTIIELREYVECWKDIITHYEHEIKNAYAKVDGLTNEIIKCENELFDLYKLKVGE